MKQRRWRQRGTALALAVATFASTLVVASSTTTVAQADTPIPNARARVVALWQTGGPMVKAEAERLLTASEAEIQTFLTTGYERLAKLDDRVAVNQMQAAGGPHLKDSAQRALDDGGAGALRAFLENGYIAANDADVRVSVNQLMAVGGPQVRAAAQPLLDAGAVEPMREFLQNGWRQPFELDLRIRVNQAQSSGGPNVKAGAQRVLDLGTLQAYQEFLDVDLPVYQARDVERATVAELAAVAKDASDQALKETTSAKEAADRAVREAAAAKLAAQDAARAAESAAHNSSEAAAAAGLAAAAANSAAAAAREAVSAANTASVAARTAANAASRAATAAALAGQAASDAYRSAALVIFDAAKVPAARMAAARARAVADGADQAANAAETAYNAANAANSAVNAAKNAVTHSNQAADSALAAADRARAAGADATAAINAANTAKAAAARATRAAEAAAAFAVISALAAFKSKTFAQRAAADARAAAEAADRAADHAGQAADAAAESTRHANAASAAARTAVEAADQAKVIYDAARAADAVRVSTRLDQAREVSAAAAASSPVLTSELTWEMAQVTRQDAQTRQLIAEATAPGVDPRVMTEKGRKIALLLARDGGSWTKEAARTALGGSDELVRDFVTNGIAVAAARDDRVTADVLTKTGTEGSKAAARAALSGSDEDVRRFLVERNYAGRDTDDRLEINRIMAAARDANRPVTQQEAQKALDAGTSTAYRKFLTKVQYSAAGIDDRVAAGRLLNDPASGPETREMAQIALDGPPGLLRQFLDVDRFNAQRHDQEQAAHNSEVLGYVGKAAASAFVALQAANEAQAAAATANDAAEEAAEYARQAGVSAGRAAEEAQKASEAADAAARSAEAAANSARTAMNAAASAQASARSAARSATWAQASAQQAAESAVRAYHSAKVAYEVAMAANKGAQAAVQDAQRAIDQYVEDKFLYGQMHDKYCQTRFSNDLERRQECSHLLTATADELTEKAYLRSYACRVLDQRPGGQGWQSCLSQVLSPDFEDQQILTVFTAVLTMTAAMHAAAVTGAVIFRVGALCLRANACVAGLRFVGAMLNYIGPEGAAFTPWISTAAGGFLVVQSGAVAREIVINSRSIGSRIAGAVRKLLGKAPEELPVGCLNSFSADTLVLMGDGSTKRIADVRPGDVVKSANPLSGTVDTAAVGGAYAHAGRKAVVDVALATGGSVEATADHPFWVAEMRDWVRAKDLKPGQHLRTDEGRPIAVSGVQPRTDTLRVFNLDVSTPDTYFVLIGGRPVLTHNANCFLAHIALGVDKGGDLVRFAESIGADHLMGDKTGWWDTFITLVDLMRKNPHWAKISFKLDGLAGADRGALAVVEEALKVAAEIRKTGRIPDGAPFYTIWEIETLVNAKLLRYLDFYYDGVKVPNPWA